MTMSNKIKVFVLCRSRGTSQQRLDAMVRLGCDVTHFDVYQFLPKRWAQWLFHAGGPFLDRIVAKKAKSALVGKSFDIAFVDNGDVVGPKTMSALRKHCKKVINFNADNPYIVPSPEKRRWDIMSKVKGEYDLNITIRRPGLDRLMRDQGIKAPHLIWQTVDEVVHSRPAQIESEWLSDVSFVGTWMPGRGEFLASLIDQGVPLTLYGPRWEKSAHFEKLKPFYRRPYLEGEDYAKAIAGAKVGLVLLNARNKDLHTNRTMEITALKTAMIAPRTAYHEVLYEDGEEALFFNTVNECAALCHRLLQDDERRNAIAEKGHARLVRNKCYNEQMLAAAFEQVLN